MRKVGGVSRYGQFAVRETASSKDQKYQPKGTRISIKDGQLRAAENNRPKELVLRTVTLNNPDSYNFTVYQDSPSPVADRRLPAKSVADTKLNAQRHPLKEVRLRRSVSDAEAEKLEPAPSSDENGHTSFSESFADHNESDMSLCTSSFNESLNSSASTVDLELSAFSEEILLAIPNSNAKRAKVLDSSTESVDSPSVTPSAVSMQTARSTFGDDTVSMASEYRTAHTSSERGARIRDRFRETHEGVNSKETYAYLRARECVIRPRPDYVTKQNDVTREMRAVLIDWISDVMAEYNMGRATFFLSVSLVDRTLSVINCPKDKLQLLGASVLFVAAKLEEVNPPDIRDIAYVTEDSFSIAHIKWMERNVLNYVKFDISTPTVEFFATYFSHLMGVSSKVQSLMWYLLELSTLEYDCIGFRPSVLAASALALAVESISQAEGWPDSMSQFSGIRTEEMLPMIGMLQQIHERVAESRLTSIPGKYSEAQYHRVAQLRIAPNVVLRRD